MKSIFFRKGICIVSSLAGLTVMGSVPVLAQTVDTANPQQFTLSDDAGTFSTDAENEAIAPVPGTTATSSTALSLENETDSPVAQANIDFGRRNRGGSSYIGVGGNLGLSGDSALGDGNFMVISKIGLTDKFSVRPSVILGDDALFLVPVTYDFSSRSLNKDPFAEPMPFAPYLGAGLAIETGNDSDVSLVISGGVDVPLNSQFTATAAVNAAFLDDTDLGLLIGVGYNFSGF